MDTRFAAEWAGSGKKTMSTAEAAPLAAVGIETKMLLTAETALPPEAVADDRFANLEK